ncbi:MAG: hypothetical protein JW806_10260 [Sedimentisphaerales bacterium]|nr:hypothetical protein [Sedimentisphaerales bacterium]
MAAKAKNHRQAAWLVLTNFDINRHDSAELIQKYCGKKCNRAAVVDITSGVIRNSIFIDNLIEQISGRSTKRISRKIINCLRIGVYELIFGNQADYAVVNEIVSLANRIGSKKSAGFANAVLRKICSFIKNKNTELAAAPSKNILPIDPKTGCEFEIEILPDADTQKENYLADAFSLPLWLIKQWLAEFGCEKTLNICFASNRRPSLYARPNTKKINMRNLFAAIHNEDIDCELIEKYKMVKLNKPGNISRLNTFKEGLFIIQDITSSLVVPLLDPQPGWKVFDICAAPGTKTTQIAELMQDKGCIIATDKDAQRLTKLEENIQRLGITSVKIMDYNDFWQDADNLASADAVLLDVPCSNTGVLAKRPEARHRLYSNKLDSLITIQLELLNLAAKLVKKGGKIAYSTCSILKQENSEIIKEFLKDNTQFELEKENLTLPSTGSCDYDGGYVAILRKIQK